VLVGVMLTPALAKVPFLQRSATFVRLSVGFSFVAIVVAIFSQIFMLSSDNAPPIAPSVAQRVTMRSSRGSR
jgi:hypothetical protein